jgi:carbamoyltransferase
MKRKLSRAEPVYLVGIGPAGHNSGVSLVEVTSDNGIRLIANHEEERFAAIKHYAGFPEQALSGLLHTLNEMNLTPRDIHTFLASWDYIGAMQFALKTVLEEAPGSCTLLRKNANPHFNVAHLFNALRAPRKLQAKLALDQPTPIIGMHHHNNHAFYSLGISPFADCREPVLVIVIDGFGDDASISVYCTHEGALTRLYANFSMFDSLGLLYAIISSTQGGWKTLSSEGRYMGAAAWGDTCRLTNPYYCQLRELISCASNGRVYINRAIANWHRKGVVEPYTRQLSTLLGPPLEQCNPDHVLNLDDEPHVELNRDRADKAAALQLLFEDALFHIVGHWIRATEASRLVLTGGTALNCVANMKLLEKFNESFYERHLRKSARLHIWVPPNPGDAGAVPGAAYQFARVGGAEWGPGLDHAFFCGPEYSTEQINAVLRESQNVDWRKVGEISTRKGREQIADLLAYLVCENLIIGVFHGIAETGPRALGHRSILANPCSRSTLQIINERVKYREKVRPLAPMVSEDEANTWFELSEGASDREYNAYNYMVLTVPVRPESHERIPAVIHQDGTARIQIVRRSVDPFMHEYLKAMGRRVGVEVSVNTSLNVRSPIAQTPHQAIGALEQSKGMDGIFLIGNDGQALLAWDKDKTGTKDGGARLKQAMTKWSEQAGASEGRGRAE